MIKPFLVIGLISILVTSLVPLIIEQVNAAAVTLSVTVGTSLSFSTDGNKAFGTLTSGTPVTATSTLSVTTNNDKGYYLTVSRDDTNTTLDLTTDATVNITDATEWSSAGHATTTGPDNVTALASALPASGQVLAFRTRSTGTEACFYSSTWWGTNDTNEIARWSGFPTTTNLSKFGACGDAAQDSVYNPSAQTILTEYRLDVSVGQQTGSYDGGLTYTATAN
jgi:hypothetical protein